MSRVLLVTMDYLPNYGGVANYYSQIVKQLKPGVAVLTNIAGQDDKNNNEFHVNFIWKCVNPQWLPLLWLIPRYLKKSQAKIIWVGNILPVGTAAYILNKFFKIPYFISLHGLDIQLTKKNAKKRKLAFKILNKANFITVNSKFTASLLVEYNIPASKIVVVYPSPSILSVPKSKIIENLQAKYQLNNKKIILTVSRLVKRKNIEQVISAVSQLMTSFSNLVYVVVGDGPEREVLEQKIGNLNNNILLIGSVDKEELSAWYNLCDIFVLTPTSDEVDVEGFGIVYLEALSLAKPVVASKVGGVEEAAGSGAKYVNNNNELVYTLKELLTNESLRKQLGLAGQQHIQQFALNRQVNKILNALGGL